MRVVNLSKAVALTATLVWAAGCSTTSTTTDAAGAAGAGGDTPASGVSTYLSLIHI